MRVFGHRWGPYDLQPTVHANFKSAQTVGEFAVAATRFYNAFMQ